MRSLSCLSWCLLVCGALAIDLEDKYITVGDDYIAVDAFDGRFGRQLNEQAENETAEIEPPFVPQPGMQPCKTSDGRRGHCMRFRECYPHFKLFEVSPENTWVMGSVDTCTYNGPETTNTFGVCCAPRDPIPGAENLANGNRTESNQGGFEIGEQINSNCGGRIVAGQTATPHEYPFMAALLNNKRQFCGGSLIDEKHVLTAAHCVAHMSKYDVQNLRVNLGDHKLNDGIVTWQGEQQYKVKRVVRHKYFDMNTLYNDVAILTLEKPVASTNKIWPICLAVNKGNKYTGEIVWVAGWGTTKAGGTSSNVLRKVKVKVWKNSVCDNSYGSDAPGGIIDSMLCASLNNGIVQDSCNGDSGGPLFKCNGPSCTQIGIVSWGISCAQARYPGVYTRITEFLPWINDIVQKY